jgi:hypothetical protein
MAQPKLRIKVKNNLTSLQLTKYAKCHINRYDVVVSVPNFSNPQLVIPNLDLDYFIDIFKPILKTEKQLILRITETQDSESNFHGIVCEVLNSSCNYYKLTYWLDHGLIKVKNFYSLKIAYQTIFSYCPKDNGIKVFKNADTLGFVTAVRIPSLCEKCHYYTTMGSIRCAVNPDKCYDKVVFECADYVKVKELVKV